MVISMKYRVIVFLSLLLITGAFLQGCPPPEVSVPDVRGLTQAAAVTALTDANLVLGAVAEAFDDTVAVGLVISQSPPPGATVERGSEVGITVSLGPEPGGEGEGEGESLIPASPQVSASTLQTSESSVVLTGTTLPEMAIRVNGGASLAEAVADGNGQFEVTVLLRANRENQLYITARNAEGVESAPSVVQVLQDGEDPTLHIDFPPDGAVLTNETITVAGRVSDLLSGFMGLGVEVNGSPAAVAIGIGTNGTFDHPGQTLVLGANVITAVATDALGNQIERQITVTRVEPTGPRMAAISGDGQSAVVYNSLPQPLRIRMTHPDGDPFEGKVVTFQVTRSNGLLGLHSNDLDARKRMVQVATDANGEAAAYLWMGSDAGCGNNRVEVTSTDISGTTYFCATALPGLPKQINIGSGNNQRTETGASAPEPLRAWVSDSCNGTKDLPVTFTVTQGGGKVNGEDSVTVSTGDTGHAQVDFVAGAAGGNNFVEATFDGNPGPPATFNILGVERTEDVPTTFRGIILDNAYQPIQGVACTLVVNNTQVSSDVTTTEQGQFLFEDIVPGPAQVLLDGLQATAVGGVAVPPGSFPSLSYNLVIVPNAENSLPAPVQLPPLNPENAVIYDGTQDVELTTTGMDGLKMIVRAGSMTLRDGKRPSPAKPEVLSLNQVHHDDVPMPMPDGVSPPFAWTVQPAGARFDPPIEVTYPNMSGLDPGAVAYFLSYNHDTEQFDIVASGSVSEDGSVITTDRGSGLTISGWGCNCPPYEVTGECRKCPDESCPNSENCSVKEQLPSFQCGVCPPGKYWNSTECIDFNCADGDWSFAFYAWLTGELYWWQIEYIATYSLATREYFTFLIKDGYYSSFNIGSNRAVGNAHRHMTWQCNLAQQFGPSIAAQIGWAHEGGKHSDESTTDLYNNFLGRELAASLPPGGSCFDAALAAIVFPDPEMPPLIVDEGDRDVPFTGEQRALVNRFAESIACPGGTTDSKESDGVLELNVVLSKNPLLLGETTIPTFQTAEGIPILEPTFKVAMFMRLDGILSLEDDKSLKAQSVGKETISVMATDGVEFYMGEVSVVVGTPSDLDGDGIPGDFEQTIGLDDSNHDDGLQDADGDLLANSFEYLIGTQIDLEDSDGDGLDDGLEVLVFYSDPLVIDYRISDAFTFSAGGRTVATNQDGSFNLANISVSDNFGSGGPGSAPDFIGDDWVRIVGVANLFGGAIYAYSHPFQLGQGQSIQFSTSDFTVSESPPPFPNSITLHASSPILVSDATSQLTTIGVLIDGSELNVTPTALGTTYRVSNTDVVTVDAEGLAKGHAPGVAFITATNNGATAVKRIQVVQDSREVRIQGIVQLPDGSPAENANVSTSFGGTTTNAQGAFTMVFDVDSETTSIIVNVDWSDGIQTGSVSRAVNLLQEGVTDAGILTLSLDDPGETVHWVGSTFGDWNDPENWSDGVLPAPGSTVIVNSAGSPVTVSIDQDTTWEDLNIRLGEGVSLVTTLTTLTIQGDTRFQGTMLLENGSTLAISGAETVFNMVGDLGVSDVGSEGVGTLQLHDGALVVLDVPALDHIEVFLYGENNSLTLPSARTMSDGVLQIESNSVFSGPAMTDLTRTSISVYNGGKVELPSLTTATGAPGASMRFWSDAAEIVAPLLTSLANTTLKASRGGVIGFPELSEFRFEPGCSELTIIEAGGTRSGDARPSSIALPRLETLAYHPSCDVGFDVDARAGGHIDLSGLIAVDFSAAVSAASVFFHAQGEGSLIDLTAMTSLQVRMGVTTDSGGAVLLPNLDSALGDFSVDNATLSLPSLTSISGASLEVTSGGLLDMPNLTGISETSVSLFGDGVFNAPLLTGMSGPAESTLSITVSGDAAFQVPKLFSLVNMRLHADRGAQLVLPELTTFRFEPGCSSLTIIEASGMRSADARPSLVSLPKLPTVAYHPTCDAGFDVEARFGGHVDLSALSSVDISPEVVESTVNLVAEGEGSLIDLTTMESFDARLTLETISGGTVLLPNLKEAVGEFSVDGGTLSLPGLTSISGSSLVIESDGVLELPELTTLSETSVVVGPSPELVTLTLPKLTSISGASLVVESNGLLDLPKLTALSETSVSVFSDGTLNMPVLTGASGPADAVLSITLSGNATFQAPMLSSLTNMTLLADLGAELRLPALETFRFEPGCSSLTIIEASGMRSGDARPSLISLPGLETLVYHPTCDAGFVLAARFGGQVDLSGLSSVDLNPVVVDAPIELIAEGEGSLLDLTAMGTFDARLRLLTSLGGTILLPNLEAAAGELSVDGTTLALPRLGVLHEASVVVNSDGLLQTPILEEVSESSLRVSFNGVFEAPELTTISGPANTTLALEATEGGAFNAPLLNSLVNMRLYASGAELVLPELSEFRFEVGCGLVEILKVAGSSSPGVPATLISLPRLSTLDYNPSCAAGFLATALNSGKLDLSHLSTVNFGPLTGSATSSFNASGQGALIDLSALDPVPAQVNFQMSNGGTVTSLHAK